MAEVTNAVGGILEPVVYNPIERFGNTDVYPLGSKLFVEVKTAVVGDEQIGLQVEFLNGTQTVMPGTKQGVSSTAVGGFEMIVPILPKVSIPESM